MIFKSANAKLTFISSKVKKTAEANVKCMLAYFNSFRVSENKILIDYTNQVKRALENYKSNRQRIYKENSTKSQNKV